MMRMSEAGNTFFQKGKDLSVKNQEKLNCVIKPIIEECLSYKTHLIKNDEDVSAKIQYFFRIARMSQL